MTKMTSGNGPGIGEYNPFAEDVLTDPAGAYRHLREQCPVHYFDAFGDKGFYTVSRNDDVRKLFTDVDLWSSDWGQGPIYTKEGGLRSDPPEHTVYRRLVTSAFTARRVAAVESQAREVTRKLIEDFRSLGQADLIEGLAIPLPIIMISHFLGIPHERRAEFKSWSDEFMAAQNTSDPAVQAAARAKIDDYFDAELNRRRALREAGDQPPDDILTSLLSAEHEGAGFTNEQLLPLILLVLVGGNETTTSLIGNLVWRLLDLGLWDAVSADPGLRDVAIDESLRFDPPVLGLFRTNKQPVCLHGTDLAPDSKVHGLYASANRDPQGWQDPDSFRLDRNLDELKRQHFSFGLGQYLCPGAALARLEGRIALDAMIELLPGLRLVDPPDRTDSFMMWGPKALMVAWDD
ncbi:MAG TPA: cytochrome P450 [Frankiaceae bacterium]|jgi:cytochrome P450|nr:cytochrome P450 [Frankiaceae bacterium]